MRQLLLQIGRQAADTGDTRRRRMARQAGGNGRLAHTWRRHARQRGSPAMAATSTRAATRTMARDMALRGGRRGRWTSIWSAGRPGFKSAPVAAALPVRWSWRSTAGSEARSTSWDTLCHLPPTTHRPLSRWRSGGRRTAPWRRRSPPAARCRRRSRRCSRWRIPWHSARPCCACRRRRSQGRRPARCQNGCEAAGGTTGPTPSGGGDALTGLADRAPTARRRCAGQCRLQYPDAPLMVLAVDVDHLRHVNDTWSHATGDAVLQAVAGVLRAQSRPQDVLARADGNLFVVALGEARARRRGRCWCTNSRSGCARRSRATAGTAWARRPARDRQPRRGLARAGRAAGRRPGPRRRRAARVQARGAQPKVRSQAVGACTAGLRVSQRQRATAACRAAR